MGENSIDLILKQTDLGERDFDVVTDLTEEEILEKVDNLEILSEKDVNQKEYIEFLKDRLDHLRVLQIVANNRYDAIKERASIYEAQAKIIDVINNLKNG